MLDEIRGYDAAVADASKARAQLVVQRTSAEQQRLAESQLQSELATERIRYETATRNAAEQTKEQLAVTVEDFRQRMNELRRAQAAADSRASLFREVARDVAPRPPWVLDDPRSSA